MKQKKKDGKGTIQNESIYDIPCSDLYLNNRRENGDKIDRLGLRVHRAERNLCLACVLISILLLALAGFVAYIVYNEIDKKQTLHIASKITLRGSGTAKSGNIFLNYQPICDDSWDDKDAKVACRMLGYQGGSATTNSKYGYVSYFQHTR